MIRKILALALVLAAASTMISQTSSYSSAAVNNNISFKIVKSEDAFISVPAVINISQEDLNKGRKLVEIKNNLAQEIQKVDGSFGNNENKYKDEDVEITIENLVPGNIISGGKGEKALTVQKFKDNVNKSVKLKFNAQWANGSAVIESTINIK